MQGKTGGVVMHVMDNKTFPMIVPSTNVSHHQIASSNSDELFMQQSMLFSTTLKDLKNLKTQLYSAAEYFERYYGKEDQEQILFETLKDYTTNALVSTIDHLGSVAYKVNSLLDEKMGEVSAVGLRISCLEQRLQTCQKYVDKGGLSQQSWLLKTPVHHKQYIFPVEESLDGVEHTRSKRHSGRYNNAYIDQFKNAVQATIQGAPPPPNFRRQSPSQSPQVLVRQGGFTFSKTSSSKRPEKRSASALQTSLMRSGSLIKTSTSQVSNATTKRYPSEPRRSASLSRNSERDGARDMGQFASKSKRLFRALLSTRKSRKDSTIYKYLDEM